ncbi:hypothetical protein V1506DRAFT_574811 [Lipomyces tetrasporus]
MALIANGRHDELRATLHGHSYDAKRQACNGHKVLVGAGFSYHPCAHGSVEKMRKCILPIQHLQVTMPNSEAQASTEETPAPDPDDIATVGNDADADGKGYCRIDLKKLHTRPFLHQLALTADNRAAELKRALGQSS